MSLLQGFFSFFHSDYKKDDLKNKVVLITGASSGLGEALAHVFFSAGCKLILASRRKAQLDHVKSSLLNENEGSIHILTVDLSNTSLESFAKEAESIFGVIDILINNAGISSRGLAVSTSLDVDKEIMSVNYFGHVALTKALLPSMMSKKSGHVIFINSMQGKIGIPFRSSYAASKHALLAFTDSLRAELTEYNVKITSVIASYIQTQLSVNAKTGDGSIYGVMDDATANGYPPEYVAKQVLECVIHETKEIVIAPLLHRFAILLRVLSPSLYFYIMAKRASKLKSY